VIAPWAETVLNRPAAEMRMADVYCILTVGRSIEDVGWEWLKVASENNDQHSCNECNG